MVKIKDYDKLYKALNNIRTHDIEILDNLPQNENVQKLREELMNCKHAEDLINLTTKVLILQLDYCEKEGKQNET